MRLDSGLGGIWGVSMIGGILVCCCDQGLGLQTLTWGSILIFSACPHIWLPAPSVHVLFGLCTFFLQNFVFGHGCGLSCPLSICEPSTAQL